MPKVDQEKLTLDNLGNGGAKELFEEELQTVLDNILDPNTEAKAKRKLTLEVTFCPSSDRDSAETEVVCKTKLAPMNGANATIFVGRRYGVPVAVTHDPEQLQLDWDRVDAPRNFDETRREDAG